MTGAFLYVPKGLILFHGSPQGDGLLDKVLASIFTSRIGFGAVTAFLMISGSIFLGDFIMIHKEIFLKWLKSLKNAAF
jgi:hypothetical protein